MNWCGFGQGDDQHPRVVRVAEPGEQVPDGLGHPARLSGHLAVVREGRVEQQNRVLSPGRILLVQLCDKFLKEDEHSHAVILALVGGKVDIASARDAENDRDHLHALRFGKMCALALGNPRSLAGIRLSEDGFINIYHSLAFM